MADKKKRVILTVMLGSAAAVLLIFGILYLITKSFAMEAMLHIYIKLLLIPIVIKGVQKSFQNHIVKEKMKKTLVFCGAILFADLVVLDAVRFVLSRGISTILFLPACLLAALLYDFDAQHQGNGGDEEKRYAKNSILDRNSAFPVICLFRNSVFSIVMLKMRSSKLLDLIMICFGECQNGTP